MTIKIDYTNCLPFIKESEIKKAAAEGIKHLNSLNNKSGRGNDFLGWLSLPEEAVSQLERINKIAERLRSQADLSIIIGIGGSYLGAKSLIESLKSEFPQQKDEAKHELIFAGQNISEDYLSSLIRYIAGRSFNIIVISKSGTTTEPAIAFRILKKLLEDTAEGNNTSRNIIAITDASKGALRTLSIKEGYETFVIPDDIGGRYSVLTPVGLLPLAVAGFDIQEFVNGAIEMAGRTRDNKDADSNPALVYAALRNILYKKGKLIEMLLNYDPRFHFIAEWWKQLFGESEGKEGKGIFPASADLTTDLHSLGQYIQEGERVLFETVLSLGNTNSRLEIPYDEDNLDKLNYIAGKRLSEVNHKAEEGTIMAHVDGGVPVIRIEIAKLTENYLGQLLYLFEISCALSGYMLGVNPFDQPGVEAYKRNMFALLGKEG